MIKVEPLTDHIVLLTADTQQELTSTFIRFQEYYESPFEEIRGKTFTLGEYKRIYAEKNGGFTYIPGNNYKGDWNGFNLPGKVLKPFYQGLFDPLTKEEQDFLELFRYRTDDFYVIGIHKEDTRGNTLKHEIAHGLYVTDRVYRERVTSDLEYADQTQLENFYKYLSHLGYAPDVHMDEAHAYLGVDFEWTKTQDLSRFGVDLTKFEFLSERLVNAFESHNRVKL